MEGFGVIKSQGNLRNVSFKQSQELSLDENTEQFFYIPKYGENIKDIIALIRADKDGYVRKDVKRLPAVATKSEREIVVIRREGMPVKNVIMELSLEIKDDVLVVDLGLNSEDFRNLLEGFGDVSLVPNNESEGGIIIQRDSFFQTIKNVETQDNYFYFFAYKKELPIDGKELIAVLEFERSSRLSEIEHLNEESDHKKQPVFLSKNQDQIYLYGSEILPCFIPKRFMSVVYEFEKRAVPIEKKTGNNEFIDLPIELDKIIDEELKKK